MRWDAPAIPLVERPPDAVLFRRPSGPVTAAAFLADAHALAARLVPARHVLNLCHDRYAFAVAFAAALLRGQVSLLASDRAGPGGAGLYPETAYPDTAAVIDAEAEAPRGLASVRVAPTGREAGGEAGRPAAAGPTPLLRSDQPAAIVFTSGSTGVPVAHRKSWGAIATRSMAAGACFGFAQANPASIVGTVPPQHMYGLETTVLLPWHAAVSSWCGPAFFPADVQAALDAVPAPRVLVTTPLQMAALLQAGVGGRHDVISATAPLDAALAAAAEAAWGGAVCEIFGATEAGSIAHRRTLADAAWRPYPGLSVTASDGGASVAAPHAASVDLADLIEPAPDGGFRLLGRRADIIKRGGRRASLEGLNRILAAVEGVADGAFVVPEDLDRRSTARLTAVVVAPGRSAAAILAELRGRIDPVFLPRRVVHVEALPRNTLGKLPRAALLALLDAAG